VNAIFEAALEIDRFCRGRAWSFCVIGGVAVQRWGEPRGTQDVDLTVLSGFGQEEPFVDALLAALLARRPEAREFALRNRVLLLRATNGTPLDLALGGLPYEDVEPIAVRQGERLDTLLIFQELEPLLALKNAPEAAVRLREILRKAQ